jgi:CRISPR/Cas system-associated endonuclease/helicase Cas3
MYSCCRDADTNANIVSCDSPVSSGKTTAIMAHLLSQAEKRGLRRIFVVLPFTSIIQQSVEVYRKSIVIDGEKPEEVVAELHHLADFESVDSRHLTALWRAPIIVTTAVAFFETLSSKSVSTLRRLHELPGSAIFVDESHAVLPPKLLPLAWKWMNCFADEWSCYWALASGSMNRFWTIDKIAKGHKRDVPDIVGSSLREQQSDFEKNRISYKYEQKTKNADELVEWVSSLPGPRLVILNAIQSAAVIADRFSSIRTRGRVEHISTSLTPFDRKNTIKRVNERLKDPLDSDWTLVATSCVEAGIDMSFRTGFRELGSLVSLLQTAGRVNREGRYDSAEVWTFELADEDRLLKNKRLNDASRILCGYIKQGVKIVPELSTDSIKREIESQEHENELIDNESSYDFPAVEKDFKVIDADTVLAMVDWNVDGKIKPPSIDWQELQRKSVRIERGKAKMLCLQEISKDMYLWDKGYDEFLGYMAGIVHPNS